MFKNDGKIITNNEFSLLEDLRLIERTPSGEVKPRILAASYLRRMQRALQMDAKKVFVNETDVGICSTCRARLAHFTFDSGPIRKR